MKVLCILACVLGMLSSAGKDSLIKFFVDSIKYQRW